MSNIFFSVGALFCITLLVITFFSKKRVASRETRLYGIMIVSCLVNTIIEFTILIIGELPNYNETFVIILNKVAFLHYIFWPLLLTLYIFYVTYKEEKKYLKFKKIIGNLALAMMLIQLFLPATLIHIDDIRGIIGMAPNFIYGCVVFFFLINIIILLINFKKIQNRKYIPFIVLLFLMIIAMIIRAIDPTILVIPGIIVYINMIMYFTIENPDIKMLEKINLAKDQAEKANMAKSDFLSSMSHEIRTPLNAIVGLSEDMKSRGTCPVDMKEDLNDVVNASNTLLEIVGNIMDISKIESNKLEIINVKYNLLEEIDKIVRLQKVRIGSKLINFSVNIAQDIPHELIGDKIQIKGILNNLLSNAIKYTEKGFIELNVRCINKKDDCMLIITVRDSGRGIKSEDIYRLFNKFDRLDVEKNTTNEGTGLGLAITKRVTEMMGGIINVNSQFGNGSIFVVQLPQKISIMTKEGYYPPQDDIEILLTTQAYSDKKILLVDDNKLNIKVAQRALSKLKFLRVDEVYNGEECLEKIISGEKYDLILMDIMMPVMSGETALKKLHEINDFNTPVIALTADAIIGAEEKYREMGFVDYVAKPFTKDIIKAKIDKIFDNK